jgi:Fe-S-cluster containining protein
MSKSVNNIWSCSRCGECCKQFVSCGVKLEKQEIALIIDKIKLLDGIEDCIIKDISILGSLSSIGNKPPKRCLFLSGKNFCLLHSVKPLRCREYPVLLEKIDSSSVIINISSDCPRGEKIASVIKESPPDWLKKHIGEKQLVVNFFSFFERKYCQAYGDEP